LAKTPLIIRPFCLIFPAALPGGINRKNKMPVPVIQTVSLHKSYYLGKETIPVLHDINLTIERGGYFAIMGPSGSGKSTLLNILGCLDTPTTGEYRINGQPVGDYSQNQLALLRNREIGFIFQNFNLLPKLDITGNVELPLIYGNVGKKERMRRIEAILKRLGLWERRRHRPNEISGGQKQRVAIARALIKNPSLILADEPTGNLDSTTSAEIMHLIQELHAEGNTILLITHEADIAAFAPHSIKLRDGRVHES
jgi:putative ABC transport system ATP-binding protein